MTPFEVVHPSGAPAYGLRLEIAGRTIAYSGDTEWTPSLVDVADGADLFICECFGWETDVPSHLSHRVLCDHAGRVAVQADDADTSRTGNVGAHQRLALAVCVGWVVVTFDGRGALEDGTMTLAHIGPG